MYSASELDGGQQGLGPSKGNFDNLLPDYADVPRGECSKGLMCGIYPDSAGMVRKYLVGTINGGLIREAYPNSAGRVSKFLARTTGDDLLCEVYPVLCGLRKVLTRTASEGLVRDERSLYLLKRGRGIT